MIFATNNLTVGFLHKDRSLVDGRIKFYRHFKAIKSFDKTIFCKYAIES